MADALTLMGFGPSVYTRIVKMALIEMELEATYVEVNPFAENIDPALMSSNPIGRVPVLKHGEFVLSETAAILFYLDQIAPGQSLCPKDPQAMARMVQVMGIVDGHLYVPLVRKAFSHGFFAPREGLAHDPDLVAKGLTEAEPALGLLDRIAGEGLQLGDDTLSLADIHLMPMIAYGLHVPKAQATIEAHVALARWWGKVKIQPSLAQTDPFAHG